MKYYDVGAIEKSFELPIGARFRFRDTLFEVAEANEGRMHPWGCSKCAFNKEGMEEICLIMKCDGYNLRHDQKYIYFKEVEETKKSRGGVTAKAECCSREKTTVSGTQLQHQDLQQILQL